MVGGFLAGTMGCLFELKNLVDMMSIGTLMAYTIVAVAVIILRYRPGDTGFHGDYMALSANKKLLEDKESDSDEEIVYCSEEHLDIIRKRSDKDSQNISAWKILMCPWSSKEASEASAFVTNLLIFISFLTSLILAYLLTHSNGNNVLWPSIFLLLALIVFCTVWIFLLPRDHQDLAFRVPLVPFLPQVSIFINLYLMLKLSAATWVRFSVWMTLGGAIYGFYGWKNSTEEKRNRL